MMYGYERPLLSEVGGLVMSGVGVQGLRNAVETTEQA